jgi:hypothetical protein
MLAPNKTGEYLSKGLYILGVKNFYMNMFESAGVGSLAESPAVSDVVTALRHALTVIDNADYKTQIKDYVNNYFCMQKQVAPIVKALKKIGK